MNFNKSAIYSITEKFVKMVAQLLLLVLASRTLEKNELGDILFCLAISLIFIFLNRAGLETISAKYFIGDNISKVYLKRVLIIRYLFSILCMILVITSGFYLVNADNLYLIVFFSTIHIFIPLNIYEIFYQAKARSQYTAISHITANVVTLLLAIYFTITSGDKFYFALCFFISQALPSIIFLIIAKIIGQLPAGKASVKKMRVMIKSSFPLIISTAAVVIYMRVDQIMLGYISGVNEVSNYVTAMRLTDGWFILFSTLISSYFPKLLITLKCNGERNFKSEVLQKSKILIIISYIIVLITCILSPYLVTIIFGQSYLVASSILNVTILSLPFVCVGLVATRIMIIRNEIDSILRRSLVGLFLNVILNFILIPKYNEIGAAWASFASQIVSTFIYNVLSQKTRDVFYLQLNVLTIGMVKIK